MASWIKVGCEVESHPKVRQLRAGMGWSEDRTLACLVRFWCAVRVHAPDGSLSRFTPLQVGLMSGCEVAEAETFHRLMHECGLLVPAGDSAGGSLVNGWMEHNGDFLWENASRQQRVAAGRSRASGAARSSGRFTSGTPAGHQRNTSGNQRGTSDHPAGPAEQEQEPNTADAVSAVADASSHDNSLKELHVPASESAQYGNGHANDARELVKNLASGMGIDGAARPRFDRAVVWEWVRANELPELQRSAMTFACWLGRDGPGQLSTDETLYLLGHALRHRPRNPYAYYAASGPAREPLLLRFNGDRHELDHEAIKRADAAYWGR